MGGIRQPTAQHVSAIEDSRRWARFQHRPDDIFVSTPPKCGTTWMQGIIASLLWADRSDPPGPWSHSPWVDVRSRPIDDVMTELDAQDHRRFIKTHSPADCVPIFEECTYVTVYRDGRDALVSWGNHRAKMRPEVMDLLNATASTDGIEPLPRSWSGDMDELFDEWVATGSAIRHLASWWPLRHEPFVHFVHYNDLTADLEGEMRRLADTLAIDVSESHWPAVVERCGLAQMRDAAKRSARFELGFEGGADSFFHKGTNGRWKQTLTTEQLARYDRLVADALPPDAADWLTQGSLATGHRPSAPTAR